MTDDKKRKLIALTFDDGPNTTTTVSVLEKLEKYGVTASFFVVGDNIDESSAEIMKKASEMGCEIANHSKTHSDMTKMTADEIKAELDYTSAKVKEVTGKAPRFFRPPYIAISDGLFAAAELPFICGFGCEDYNDSVTAEERAQRTLSQARDGAIILLHDMEGNFRTVDALDIIIPKLKEQDYSFVTVSQLFEESGVTPAPHAKIVYSYPQQTELYG